MEDYMHLLKAMGLKGDESFEEIEAKLDAGDVDVARLLNKRSEKDKQQRKDCCQKAAQAPFPPFLGPHYGWVTSFSDTGLFVEDGSRCWITTVCDSASSHTLATSTTTHKPTVEDVWTTLCMAMAYPMVGPARKPRHLLIAHRMAQMAPELRVRLARWGVDSRLESRAEAELICAQYGTDPDGLNNQEKTAEDAPMPPLEVALKERGNECFTAGKYDQAVSYYSQALQLAPEDNVLYSNRSIAHLKAGDAQAALDDADACVRLSPKFVKGHARRGQALEALGRWSDALQVYERYAAKFPADGFFKAALQRARQQQQQQQQQTSDSSAAASGDGR